ncbi:putative LRR receptor-like serine/threonine-protein kinase [Glycine soja]|uniref:Putative LRR receptor-like serine/threonine-protein kinase n=1 Tax=Glycine soja TaxID=3848 RepID=A0A445LMA0_GLYSO|nr:putative LRR receptor-like serine/threonine-protein kinase [Glycine soja]
MGDKVMREISKEKTAATIWLKLENLYMTKSLVNRLFLKQKLYTLKMPSGKALEDHLNDFNKIFLIWKKIEIKLGDEDHALLLLKSLPSEFDSLSDTLIWQGLTVIGESLDYFILKGIKEEVSGKSCGSEEHLKKECHEYKKKKRHGDQRSHNGDAAVVSEGYESDEVMRVSEVSIKPEWVLDSGCTFQCVLTWIGSAHMRKAMEGSAFGKLQKMQALELSGNKLSGVIPTSIGHFSRLFYLGLGENIGAIPLEIFNLSSLTDALAVSQNSLSGSIPKEVGIIPSSLASLQGLQRLDLSQNHLFGSIPNVLQNISSLEYLNVSFNMLDGEVPTEEHPRTLNLDQRLNIIIDVASALHYLHHECEQPIIHCDLKPSNVLLDDDMVAHVNDFGIARLLSTINGTPSKQTSTIGIKGTVGNSWLFSSSFGILVLEMLTGRKLTDEIFEDGQNLHNFVENSFPDNILQILDPSLVPNHGEAKFEEENGQNLTPNVEKCLVSLFNIGISCSVESPKERMNMVDVTRELSKTRKTFIVGVETREEFKSAAEMDTRNKSEHFSTADMKKGIITFRIDDRIEIKK